jgi:hypothetical protein
MKTDETIVMSVRIPKAKYDEFMLSLSKNNHKKLDIILKLLDYYIGKSLKTK